MNKNISIVYSRTIAYDFNLQQRPHHLMNILAERGYDIAWLDDDGSCKRRPSKLRTKINDNLHVYYDWEVFRKRFAEPDIYFSSWSERYKDLDYIKPKYGVIYDSLDNFEQNASHESEMLKHSDIVLTTSSSLYRLRKKEHNNIRMCYNACFPEVAGKKYPVPLDMARRVDMNKPIILFSGAMAIWCDLDIIEAVANKYQLVFVGRPWAINKVPDNVIDLGCKTYEELQSYYHHCDVTLLPFNRRQEARYSDPIKIYESLAHGKICVSTNIEESMKFNRKVVYISKSKESFLQNVNKAIKNSKSEETKILCQREAEKHSWEKRVDVIEECINELMGRN